MTKESKRSRNHQANRRQYKVRLIEKPLVLSRASVTLTPTTTVTTTTTTPPTTSNTVSVITPWPSTSSASANLFISILWPRTHNKEDTPMSVLEEKQKVRKLNLSKFKNSPAREITTYHPVPSVTENSVMASIMVATNTPSPAKMYRRWGPPCPFCVQSAPHPFPVDADWSEEDRDGGIEKEKRREKQRKEEEMKWGQEEEKKIFDSNYYPPEPMYVPSHEE